MLNGCVPLPRIGNIYNGLISKPLSHNVLAIISVYSFFPRRFAARILVNAHVEVAECISRKKALTVRVVEEVEIN